MLVTSSAERSAGAATSTEITTDVAGRAAFCPLARDWAAVIARVSWGGRVECLMRT